MGILNTHQVLKGARTRGGIKTYVTAGLIEKPEVTVATTVASFAGGLIEFDGRDFTFAGKSLDFAPLAPLLADQHEYIICAVPKYNEYADRAAAEAANANYFVTYAGQGEAFINYFLPSTVEAAVRAKGGALSLRKKRSLGTATPSEIATLNMYDSEVEKLTDPRFTGRLLDFVGIEFMLADVYNQDNRSKNDALAGMTNDQLMYFLSTQGDTLSERKVLTLADANTAYSNKIAKLKRAFGYASQNDAINNVNGHELALPKDGPPSTAFTTPKRLDTGAASAATHVAVYEFYYPSFMPEGHEGMETGKFEFLTKENSAILGRVNPIYYENPMQVARTMIGSGPKSAATLYADPQAITRIRVTKSAETVTAIAKVSDEAEYLIGNTTL